MQTTLVSCSKGNQVQTSIGIKAAQQQQQLRITMKMSVLSALLLAALVSGSAGFKFGRLCSDNPSNQRRGSDTWGGGAFGDGRGSRRHEGVDIICHDGDTVYAPFDLTIDRKSAPYTDRRKAAINNGIKFTKKSKDSPRLCFKLWYIEPVKYSGELRKGERMGTMLPMQDVYPGITSHVHVEMCNKADPTQYF